MKLDRDRNNTSTKGVLGTEDSCEGEQGGGGLCRRTRGEKEKRGHLPLFIASGGAFGSFLLPAPLRASSRIQPTSRQTRGVPGLSPPGGDTEPRLGRSHVLAQLPGCPSAHPAPVQAAGDTVPPPGRAAGEIAGIASAQVVLTPPAACNCQQGTLPDKFAARCFPSCCPGEVTSPTASHELFGSNRCWFLTRLLG